MDNHNSNNNNNNSCNCYCCKVINSSCIYHFGIGGTIVTAGIYLIIWLKYEGIIA